MRLAVLGEDLLDRRVRLLAGLLDGLLHHAPTAIRHHGSLAWLIGLQADDHIVDLRGIDIASREGVDIRRRVGVHIIDTLLALHRQIVVVEVLPQVLRLVGRIREERFITLVRRVVLLNEVTNVDVLLPVAGNEPLPSLFLDGFRGHLGHVFNC